MADPKEDEKKKSADRAQKREWRQEAKAGPSRREQKEQGYTVGFHPGTRIRQVVPEGTKEALKQYSDRPQYLQDVAERAVGKHGTVDRIEGDYAVVEDTSGNITDVPLGHLKGDVREGGPAIQQESGPPPWGTVDRIEGDFAVVEDANGNFVNVPLRLLPEGIREGSPAEWKE